MGSYYIAATWCAFCGATEGAHTSPTSRNCVWVTIIWELRKAMGSGYESAHVLRAVAFTCSQE